METTAKTAVFTNTEKKEKEIALSPFWEKMEAARFPVISMTLIIVGCMAGIAAGFGADNSPVQIGMLAIPATVAEALILGVAPMRWIIYGAVISIIADFLVMLF